MKLEEALIKQAPSLALQRAAHAEIYRLKHVLSETIILLNSTPELPDSTRDRLTEYAKAALEGKYMKVHP